MRIKNRRDFFSALMFIVVGVAFAIGASNYPLGTADEPGAGYFPMILSALMVLLGAIELLKSILGKTVQRAAPESFAWRPLMMIVLAIALFGLCIDALGLALSVPILVVVTSLAGQAFRWLEVLVNAVVLTVFSWLVFVLGLKLSIPLWPVAVAG